MYDVTINRKDYIGGSDIPAVMGISPFKTRFQLLKEKAGLAEDEFSGNEYTEYGVAMEGKIRDHINSTHGGRPYNPDRVVRDSYRYHSDGFDGDTVLEIKTTSQIHPAAGDYKQYLAQLLFGMELHKVDRGVLAVYERPEDFSTEFNEDRLTLFDIQAGDYKQMADEIQWQLEIFEKDLEYLKANPFADESELPSRSQLAAIAEQAVALEHQLAQYKGLEKQYKAIKDELKTAMEEHGVKSWVMNGGTRITLVSDGKPTTAEVFDEDAFKQALPHLYKLYTKTKTKRGRKGYVKITI